ncbi:MAG: hypothetical protein HQ530_00325 [Parcubacteria group bacterium]|nr:hypothetical protein [Parcubacteria group bacterium]
MDIPSIKIRFVEKLKLYHDYLSPNSVWETQKKDYWKHEKIILLWAFSDLHEHLYSSVDTNRLLEIYSLDKEGEEINSCSGQFIELQEKMNIDYREEMNNLKQDLKLNSGKEIGKLNFVKGNLVVKEFAVVTEEGSPRDSQSPPKRIRINAKGLLLGEMLYEAHSNNTKSYFCNFRIYKMAMGLLWSLFLIAIGIIVMQLIVLIVEIY